MRGFPIGSLVVRRKLATGVQDARHGDDDRTTHHLLDGQQRAQAIRLGFEDAFGDYPHKAPQILWLDLNPDRLGESRAFLFRVTTVAHPWGYQPNDGADRVAMRLIRESLEKCGQSTDGEGFERRPRPKDCWPIAAAVPVPFAWLAELRGAADENAFWAGVRSRCAAFLDRPPHQTWSKKAVEMLGGPLDAPALRAIWCGIRCVWNAEVPILELPEDAVAPPTGREADNPDQDNVTNMENLFHRLNRGGTPLDGDDLAYSMIKAYWPGLEQNIGNLARRRRLPEARLVRVAARLPIGEVRIARDIKSDPGQAVSSSVSIGQIRRLAHLNKVDEDSRGRFERFFVQAEPRGLGNLLAKIESWCGPSTSYSLLPVLQTSIARNSPDIYALLLWMADKALRAGNAESEDLGKPVQGLITALHWFALDKRKAVSAVAARLGELGPLSRSSFKGILAQARVRDEYPLVRLPLSVSRFEAAIPFLKEAKTWGCWTAVKQPHYDGPEREAVERVIDNREMLLYAQRAFLMRKYKDYDPADEETWAQHNRPWDFDHILPKAAIDYVNFPNREVVKEWALRSIANLRAWPLEANRSDQREPPEEKINMNKKLSRTQIMEDSFLKDDEFAGFGEGYNITQSSEGSPGDLKAYVEASRARLIRIYRAWYDPDGLDIGYLTDVA